MSRSHSYQAIVLRTYDIGEADRFCVLFTRERGRLPARASGVRRTGSRMGGSLLPCRTLTVQLREWGSGFIVESAQASESTFDPANLQAFSWAHQGIEVLLALTEDDHPLPEIYDAMRLFLELCGAEASPELVLGFILQLLSLLGLLPEPADLAAGHQLNMEELAFVEAAVQGQLSALPALPSPRRLNALSRRYLEGHLRSPLRATGFLSMLE